MARTALTLVGQGLGSLVGGPLGGVVGGAVGAFAGSALENALADPVQGPRLSELGVSASTYGNAIPRIRGGAMRLPGNMIWSTGLIESRRKGGKSNGGKGPRTVAYTYSVKCAFGFCLGEVGGLLRLWADGRLIYDATGGSASIQIKGLAVRFYTGTETQEADPALVAALGADLAPAHRGLAYAVLEMSLEEFGNRVPAITAEIAAETSAPIDADGYTVTASPSVWASPAYGTFVQSVDPVRRIVARVNGTQGGVESGVALWSLSTERELRAADFITMLNRGGVSATFSTVLYDVEQAVLTPGGPGLLNHGRPSLNTTVYRFDPESLTITGKLGNGGFLFTDAQDTPAMMPLPGKIEPFIVYGTAGPRYYVAVCGQFSRFRIVSLSEGAAPVYKFGALYETDGTTPRTDWLPFPSHGSSSYRTLAAAGEATAETTTLFVFHGNPGADAPWSVYRLTVGSAVQYDGTTQALDGAGFGFASDKMLITAAIYDATDGGFLLHISDQTPGGGVFAVPYLAKWHPETGVAWCIAAPAGRPLWAEIYGAPLSGQIDTPTYGYFGDQSGTSISAAMVDTRTGAVLSTQTLTVPGGAVPHIEAQHWSADSGAIIYGATYGGGAYRAYLGRRSGADADLADVVQQLCTDAGLSPADIDVSDLSGTVRGFVAAQESVRAALAALGEAYSFDGVESDDQLAFRHRDRASVATLAYDDLLRPGQDAPVLAERRAQAEELPRRVTVQFRDRDRDQQTGAAAWSRRSAPTPVVRSLGERAEDLSPLVLTAGEATAIARRACFTAWVRARAWDEIRLAPTMMRLDAGDPVTLELEDGRTLRARVERVELGADWSVAARLVADDAALYGLAEPPGSAGLGLPVQAVAGPYASRLILGQMPLLADADDTGGLGLRAYAGVGAYAGQVWRGAALYLSRDGGVTWDAEGACVQPVAWGSAVTALPAPASPWTWDRTNTLRVAMTEGLERLEAATELETLNGANAAALISGSTGAVEILRFAGVTDNGDGTATLDTLLRGRRGTELACSGHAVGDLFVLLEGDGLERLTLPLADLDVSRLWRAVGRSDLFEATPVEPRALEGRAEMPLFPVRIRGARDGSGNLTITWKRRTRIGGAWRGGTGTVPLGEASEAYNVEILDGGGAVVRTLSGLSTPSAAYSAAQQVTDFGAAQAAVAVRVYQISDAVGRGDPGSATI